MAEKALAAAHAAGVPARDVFVPRSGATPSQVSEAKNHGYVTPLYTQYSPAPIGLADYGLSANPNGNGSIVPSILNTSSLLATFNPNSTGVLGSTAFSSSPDAYGVQLERDLSEVSPGAGRYRRGRDWEEIHSRSRIHQIQRRNSAPNGGRAFAACGRFPRCAGLTAHATAAGAGAEARMTILKRKSKRIN